jgi:hypothetical protein
MLYRQFFMYGTLYVSAGLCSAAGVGPNSASSFAPFEAAIAARPCHLPAFRHLASICWEPLLEIIVVKPQIMFRTWIVVCNYELVQTEARTAWLDLDSVRVLLGHQSCDGRCVVIPWV